MAITPDLMARNLIMEGYDIDEVFSMIQLKFGCNKDILNLRLKMEGRWVKNGTRNLKNN